jgi:pimeloyl-ACP methyl ester carboxylesterase
MSTFVLVHGAWHGAWCWERVVPLLRDAGHEVVTPTLTGLGERADELTPDVGLRTHVADVEAALGATGGPVVLVGHSYAGLVVREAADRAPGAVERLVLVDGWAGHTGASLFGLAPAWFVDALRASADEHGDGWRIPTLPAATVGVTDPDDAAWLEREMTDHPLRTFADPTELTGAVDAIPGTAIVCRPAGIPFDTFAEAIGYRAALIDTGHDAMVTAPAELAALLV